MRYQILFWYLFNLVQNVTSMAPSLEDMLLTNQYLLISQHGCITQFESNITHGLCPQILQKPISSNQLNCLKYPHRVHLLRDPDGFHPPLLGIISEKDGFTFSFLEIDGNAIFGGKRARKWWTKEVSSSKYYSTVNIGKQAAKMYSIYDTMSQTLYVMKILENGARSTFSTYYFTELFSENRYLKREASQYLHPNNHRRFEWTEDVYENKVYYKEKNGEQTTTYVVSMDRILPTLVEGRAGQAILTTADNWGYLSFSGGMISEKRLELLPEGNRMVSIIRPVHHNLTGKGIQCQYVEQNSIDLTLNQPIVVIRDNDYCLIRRINREDCEIQRNKWLLQKRLVSENESSLEKWFVMIIVILTLLIILLFVYIYWLRSTFLIDYEYSVSRRYENENEASQFINRQRSFPTSYADPGTLDVSVDRWN